VRQRLPACTFVSSCSSPETGCGWWDRLARSRDSASTWQRSRSARSHSSSPSWYASLVAGPTGILLSQRAFQVGCLLAPVNAVISAVDPITAIAIAVLVLGERLNSASLAMFGEVTGAVVVVLGIVITVRRSDRILRDPAVAGRG
jgi:drug/metabolite transporter (DMT)-like permease